MHKKFFAVVGFILFSHLFFACSSEDANTCERAADCDRGQACLENSTCGVSDCTLPEDCRNAPPFVEGCLRADSAGNYNPTLAGVCTAQECRNDAECGAPAVCFNNVCYEAMVDDIQCTDRNICPDGLACMSGICAENTDGFCSDINQCPVGETCDETHQCVGDAGACSPACAANENCIDGACVSQPEVCEPACSQNEDCFDSVCVPRGTGGGLCSTCSTNEDCGGESDICVILAGSDPFCGSDCSTSCPSGFTCQTIDTAGTQQCTPSGDAGCSGCLLDGCASGQFCNGVGGSCQDTAGICEQCAAADQCGEAICASVSGSLRCLSACGEGCGSGYSCETVNGRDVCMPDTGSCGSAGCELTQADCSGSSPHLNAEFCRCVACLSVTDCAQGQFCADNGACLSGSSECESTSDCGDGYCQAGVCIECLGRSDCDGQNCIAGACETCDCPSGQRCSTIDGSCEDIPSNGECDTNLDCVSAAQAAGHDGEGVACDPTVGCFVIGKCGDGGSLSDGVFNASCPIGVTCGMNILASGEGTCTGCDLSNPNSCRVGETCSDFLSISTVCGGSLF